MKGILINDAGDLMINVIRDKDGKITSGIAMGDTRYQRSRLIIEANKGEFKNQPMLGLGIVRFLKGVVTPDKKQQFISELETELLSDGMKTTVTLNDNFEDFELNIED